MRMPIKMLAVVATGLALSAAQTEAAPRLRPTVEAAATPIATEVLYRRDGYVVGGVYYFNGYRGYLRPRPGYRYYNGYWFPGAAFAAGVAAGRAATAVRPAPILTEAHIRWCYDHYVSYRAWDNSYQPYAGPRRQCWSPYN